MDSNIDGDGKKSSSVYHSWQCDRSDLGSIDSSIFKHSLHQSGTSRTDSTKVVSRAEIHQSEGARSTLSKDNESLKETIKINEDALSGITIIEIKDRKPDSSVISYDSIYLSSESDRQTVLGDIDAKIKDFEDIIKELNVSGDSGKVELIIDNLYSQVGKGKTAEVSVRPNANGEYVGKETLERLTVLAGRFEHEDKTRGGGQVVTDFQYASLPDAGISKLLRDSELIDARLRDDASVVLLEPYPDYDSLPNDANAPSLAGIKVEPISLEENPKGAPSIELVRQPTKEKIDKDAGKPSTKVYLPEIGIEFDYEDSIASFESSSDFESPPPPAVVAKPPPLNLVTVSGRKVFVDELAAKVEPKEVVDEPRDTSKAREVVQSANSRDKDKTRREETIKVSECKQQSLDSSDKTTLLFHLNETNESEKPKATAVQSRDHRLLRRNCLSFNMPRPQLLSIVDSKNSTPKRQTVRPEVRVENEKGQRLNPTELEFLHKVDSARSYWSKMNDEESSSNLRKNFKSSNDIHDALKSEDFQSFFPTVEIVELNGETQAALVTARKLNDVEFDHIRYKVMKSDNFQKNMLVGNRKETQFDGLMQYLQDYSFQELLASNNVVIIEPVRTKIEKVEEKPNKAQAAACKITNGAALNRNGSNNLKKHFFYQPIRVNKELYEEELPVPDTVRNVRKLFEGSLKRATKPSPEAKKSIRYLAIDTSYDNHTLAVSKWDSISLSSGVSSAADLNSPCECQDGANKDIKFADNVDDEEGDEGEFKSHFVSADVLEKIRECGSSVTYYGGEAQGKKISSDAMTKAIQREINSQKCNCQSRRSRQSEKSVDYSGELLSVTSTH